MKKQLILACLLFFLLITGSVSQVVAAETRGDTLFNEAYTEVQVLINEIDRTSQYYNYIPAVDHFLDAVADEGIASSKKLSSQRNDALELLKQQLDDLYEERRVARLEYEDLYTQYLTEGKFAALEALEQKYKGQVEGFDNQERTFRNTYDQTVTTAAQKLWNLYNNLTLTVEGTKMDVLAAEQIYHKCQEAEELLFKATEAQKNSQAGKELQTAVNDARAALNGETFEVSAFVKMLEAFLQYIEAFTRETTGIGDAVLSEVHSDVYTVNGVLLLHAVTRNEAAQILPAGLYVIGNSKVWLP